MKDEKRIALNLKIIDNIYAVCKLRKMKIGEVERKIGVHLGYFAKKRNYQASLGLTEVYETAEVIGVTIDELTSKDFTRDVIHMELEEIEQKKTLLLKMELDNIEK